MDSTTTIVFLSVAFVLSLGVMPILIRFAQKRNLLEQNNERKLHTEKVSNFGGIGILGAFLCSMLLIVQPEWDDQIVVFAFCIPLFLLSLMDDLYNVGVTLRFVVQALLGLGLYEMGYQILLFDGLWMLNLGATIFFIMLMINAFNLIDGINGLAGGFGLIGCIVFGVLLAEHGSFELAMASFAYAGAILGFLFFNYGKKARIFMGDNGSTVLGFFMSVLVLGIFKAEGTTAMVFSSSAWLVVLAVVSIPVIDVFKVMSFRLAHFRSPFSPDRSHIHHLFTDGLLSHPMACAVLHGWTMLLVGLAIYFPTFLTVTTIAIAAAGPYILGYSLRVLGKALASKDLGEVVDDVPTNTVSSQ